MTMDHLSPLLFAVHSTFAFVSIAILVGLYRAILHPLRGIPGPFLAKFTELWRTRRYFSGYWHEDILNLHKKYGPVVRIAPNEVSVVHINLTTTAYGYGSAGAAKTPWYSTWATLGGRNGPNGPPSFFGEQNPETHSFMRKRVSHIYSMYSIVGAQDKIQVVLDSLWEKFDRFAKEGEEINLSKWAFYFTYDVVGTITWSEPLGMIREEKDVGNYIRLMHEAFYWICNLGYLPGGSAWITHPLTARIAPLFGSSMHLSATPFQRETFQKVTTRMKAGPVKDGQPKDMLDHFLGLKDQEGKPLTLAGIMPEVGNPMAAGADTTSIGIRAVLAPVLRSEKHYKRLQDEIDQARKHASLGDEEVLRFDVLSGLPFLSACIKEGGRMHSSIVYNLPRNVPKGGVTFDQYFIPETATLSYSPLAQNRCKAIFGDDADQWRPERWIEGQGSSEEELRNMNKYLATFGYGSRACIGRNLAMFEMYNFIGQIFSRYDIELLDKERPLKIRSSWISDLENMRIRLKKRSFTTGL